MSNDLPRLGYEDHRSTKTSGANSMVGKAMQRLFTKLWEFCKEDPSRVTFSLKVGLAITLSSLLVLLRKPYDAFGSSAIWVIITVGVVFEYTVGATFRKGFNRALGSIAAGVLALSVIQLALLAGTVAEPVIIGFSIFLVGVLTSFMKLWPSLKEYEYSFRVVLFTFSLLIVSAYRVGNPLHTAMDRLYSISIGAAVTMVVCATIFPCWAGEQLHKQIVKNFEAVADFLEECVKEYFQLTAVMDDYEEQPTFQKCKSAMESSSKEESMANNAKWEPPHGQFRHFFYPWSQYVKVGAVLRHCAFEVLAIHGCLHSEIQAPYNLRKAFESELLEASREAAALVRELGRNIKNMHQPNLPKLVLERVHSAAERLQRKNEEQSHLLLNSNPRIIFYPELSHPSDTPNSPRSPTDDKHDVESNCEPAMTKLQQWASPVEFHHQDHGEDEGERKVEKMRASESIAGALALSTFASLLMEFMARLDHLVDAVHELGILAKFKYEDKDFLP